MKKQKNNESGITLIALVITIIVLLILAGVTLSILLQTGIIENSQRAVDTYQAKAKNETETMDYLQDKFGLYVSYLDNINGKENKKMIEDEDVGYTYYNPVVPVGFKAVNTEDASWKVVEDKELGKVVQGWNSGLVIEDKDGNQFVWVPAQKVGGGNAELVEYKKTLGPKNDDKITEETITDNTDELPDGVTNENLQIEKYEGFYIARYEAGIPEDLVDKLSPKNVLNYQMTMHDLRSVEGIPVSKKNQVPWNNIDYTQAKANAESMYNNENIKSGLLTGKMWDTTLAWLEKTEAVTSKELNQDSKNWGNYKSSTIPGVTSHSEYIGWSTGVEWIDGIVTKTGMDNVWLLKTGNTEYTKRNNIYDLAGNLWEWTYETINKSSAYVERGGGYTHYDYDNPASWRSVDDNSFSNYQSRFPCCFIYFVVYNFKGECKKFCVN